MARASTTRDIRMQGNVRRPTSDRKSTRLNSSHLGISYAVFCLKKKKNQRVRESKYKITPRGLTARGATLDHYALTATLSLETGQRCSVNQRYITEAVAQKEVAS